MSTIYMKLDSESLPIPLAVHGKSLDPFLTHDEYVIFLSSDNRYYYTYWTPNLITIDDFALLDESHYKEMVLIAKFPNTSHENIETLIRLLPKNSYDVAGLSDEENTFCIFKFLSS